MPSALLGLIAVLLLGLASLIARWQRRHPVQPDSPAITTAAQRLLRPRTPHDGPACANQEALPTPLHPSSPAIRPWREGKSRRGAPKRIAPHGVACPNHTGV